MGRGEDNFSWQGGLLKRPISWETRGLAPSSHGKCLGHTLTRGLQLDKVGHGVSGRSHVKGPSNEYEAGAYNPTK